MLAVVLNIILDPLFIAGFNMGMAGAAYATVLAQGIAFVYGITYSLRKGKVPFTFPSIPVKKYAKAVIKLGIPGGLQMVAISSGIIVILWVVNSFGSEVIAGFGAAQRIENLIMIPALTLGAVVNSMSGQNIGAKRWDRVSGIAYTGAGIIMACSLVISALVFFNASFLIKLFISDPETVSFGTTYLKTTSFFYVFLGINFVLNGIARSSGAMIQVLILNIVSFWILRFPLVYSFASWYGEIGIAYGTGLSFVISSLIAALYFFFGKWRDVKIYNDEKEV